MNIKELITELNKFPPETEVLTTCMGCGGTVDLRLMHEPEAHFVANNPTLYIECDQCTD